MKIALLESKKQMLFMRLTHPCLYWRFGRQACTPLERGVIVFVFLACVLILKI